MTIDIVAELAEIVGPAHVLTDRDTTARYVADWTGRWHGMTTAVVRPADTEEVARVIRVCRRAGIGVVPQGGNTGLVGGSIPLHGEIVLSLARLDSITAVDPIGHTIAAGAGVTVARAQAAAREAGLIFGVDLASRDSATLGGIVATNAGGVRVIKYGDTRAQLLGIEAVISDGSVLTRWKTFTKDNVGYHLPSLLAGSEGTLAIVTRVLMKLQVPPPHTQLALAGVPTIGSALALLDALRRTGLTIEAAELMTDAGLRLVRHHRNLRPPLGTEAPFFLLAEVSGPADAEAMVLETLEGAGDLIIDATIEQSSRLWDYREGHTESINASSTTPPVKLDITTPLAELESFVAELTRAIAVGFPDVRLIFFGHVADGNVHVNLLDVDPEQTREITDVVFELVAAHDGSISAEHGIGRSKAAWMHLARSAVDVEVMKAIRHSIDPPLILNPHILPAARPDRTTCATGDGTLH
ncbi:FAD-binding oxidoreductase [Nocardia beijingensis]|uniref:FAD-binding oxidoreductase n=1 Tax=Nocardia beijingensis TaxID=95162 RepID=UPI001895B79A|nr:FAD-binding oxidoreductase [Nocardia beijingensis]MBF6468167.1 FAD-binding oxidoreductase [Nocardia beijingensis]